MKGPRDPMVSITVLLILVFGVYVAEALTQKKRTSRCGVKDYDCLLLEHAGLVAAECKRKGGNCTTVQYTKMIESNADDGVAYYGRGQSCSLENPEAAVRDYRRAVELMPEYFQPYVSLGLLLVREKQFDKALVEFGHALDAAALETRDGGSRKLTYLENALSNRGFAYLMKRDFDNALADYNKIIELIPNSSGGYRGRGDVFAARAEFERAVAEYTKAIKLSPSDDQSYTGRGYAYAERREFAKAVADYSVAIVLIPDWWMNYYIRGHLYLKLGEKTKSDADLQKATELKAQAAKRRQELRGCLPKTKVFVP